MSKDKGLDVAAFRPEDLANADHDVLKRLLGEDVVPGTTMASHSSHASGTGRGHSSYVNSMTPKPDATEDKPKIVAFPAMVTRFEIAAPPSVLFADAVCGQSVVTWMGWTRRALLQERRLEAIALAGDRLLRPELVEAPGCFFQLEVKSVPSFSIARASELGSKLRCCAWIARPPTRTASLFLARWTLITTCSMTDCSSSPREFWRSQGPPLSMQDPRSTSIRSPHVSGSPVWMAFNVFREINCAGLVRL